MQAVRTCDDRPLCRICCCLTCKLCEPVMPSGNGCSVHHHKFQGTKPREHSIAPSIPFLTPGSTMVGGLIAVAEIAAAIRPITDSIFTSNSTSRVSSCIQILCPTAINARTDSGAQRCARLAGRTRSGDHGVLPCQSEGERQSHAHRGGQ